MQRRTLVTALLRLSARLPLAVVHSLGSLLGSLLWLTPNRPRRVALRNLVLCLPDHSFFARQRLLRQTLSETSKAILELGPLWLWPGPRVLATIRSVEGEADWQQALAAGNGAIAVSPHLGAWELIGLYLSDHYHITSLYRPGRLDIDELMCSARQRLGARLVPTDSSGVRALAQALRRGEVIGILPDQDPGRDNGIFAPFFGQPANTMALLSRLAIKSQAPVFLTYTKRLPWGQGYRLYFERLPDTVSSGSLENSVAAINQAVETAIRRCPNQYLWAYKRFKTRPPDMPKVYQ